MSLVTYLCILYSSRTDSDGKAAVRSRLLGKLSRLIWETPPSQVVLLLIVLVQQYTTEVTIGCAIFRELRR